MGQDLLRGKEIYIFFGQYNINGILGIVVSSILMGLIIYKTLNLAKENNINEYKELLKQISKNEKLNQIIYIIINIFLLISFYIMVAGFSAYFSQELGIPNIVGSIIIVILCYFIFMGNIKRIIKINEYLIPILIICILLLMIKNINAFYYVQPIIHKKIFLKSIWDAIIYASYNSIVLIPILLSLQKFIIKKNQIRWIAIISIIILIILA